MNGLLDFFSAEAGQRRRRALDEGAQGLLDDAAYYLRGTGLNDRLRGLLALGDMLNPVSDIGRAGQSARVVFDPNATTNERIGATGSMLTDMASVLAPAAAAAYVGQPATAALTESLANLTMPADDAVMRFAAADDGALWGADSVDEVLGFVRSGRPFYHSGTADIADDIHRYGVEPQVGDWVREVARGSVDDDMMDAILDAPAAAWWADAPEWVRAKAARAAGKHVNDLTDDDIRKFGHLAIADADDWGSSVYRVGSDGLGNGEYSRLTTLDGDTVKLYETSLYDYDTQGKYPFGVERDELITAETVDPRYSLTGNELLEFLRRYNEPAAFDPIVERGKHVLDMLASGRGSEVTDEMLDLGDPVQNARLNQYLFNNYDLPMDEASRLARADQYWPDDAYHSTRSDFSEFGRGDVGYHVGTEEQASNRLSQTRRDRGMEGEAILPVRVRTGNSLLTKDAGEWDDARFAGETLADARLSGARDVAEEAQDIAPQFEDNDFWKWSPENEGLLGDLRSYLNDAGYDSVKYANEAENAYGDMPGLTRQGKAMANALRKERSELMQSIAARRAPVPDDPAQLDQWLSAASPKPTAAEQARIDEIAAELDRIDRTMVNDGSSYIITDPANIRSRFARFDPRLAHLRNLSAGLAGVSLLTSSPEEIEAYLGSL